ncbi:M1 family metallopeptidase [Gillisia sp. Hel_I_86]|uniref:M1 family metallopeptidase n=1 Tax=Gillisia sp. Hel_I_86 TaxID=1249981 RepID=UPI0011A347FC|nr:M1 family metallopeptidase [Gillisia sp. Hel_I_86]
MKQLFLLFSLAFYVVGYAQYDGSLEQTNKVDFLQMDAEVSILPQKKSVEGKVVYRFKILDPQDSIFIDAKNMQFSEVLLNGKKVPYTNDSSRIWIKSAFSPKKEYQLHLKYTAKPKQAMYFINWDAPNNSNGSKQVWTQGQGRDNSNWLPSFDDMTEKLIFNLTINFNKGYQVISNGGLAKKTALNDSITQWKFKMEKPMSSYLVAVAAGKYDKLTLQSKTAVPIHLYFEPKDSLKAEPTYRHTKEIFDFFEEEIGVPYPWENYKQVPVQDFLFAGMENTGTTIFSDALVIDSTAFVDQNYVFVNAHELVHQWFGNMVTETNGKHHWLHEGFATYYAWMAEKGIFGEDYFYWKLYESAEQLKELSDSGKGESLLDPKASSLTFYQKGAWALHILKELIGEDNFRKAIKSYLIENAYSNVTTEDFVRAVEEVSKIDISAWKQDWLQQSAFQGTEALVSLKRSGFITKYMELASLRETSILNKKEYLEKALDFPVNEYIGQETVFQLSGESLQETVPLYKKALETNNVMLRQAVAVSIDSIPSALKSEFIELLEDDSYITKENALLKSWLQFPEETLRFLNSTQGIHGFQNKNVRLLWLVINLVSPEIDPEKKPAYFEELSGYTSETLPFGLRQNAFGYLYQINAFTEQNLLDLLEGAQHHTYSFRNYCRSLLDKLLKEEEYRTKYVALSTVMENPDLEFLTKRLQN